jgi:hypothetical protein
LIDYTLILTSKYAGKEWILDGDDYAGLTWLDESPKPSKATLDALWQTVLDEKESERLAKVEAKAALLERLGITADEAALLLG